jgi:Asp-tRNA(Asn)/Glu-tRNA(Gln) amidotransferase A subunit family amidase
VPIATGSQTAGSVIRPAAYCGAFGYKPTHGRFDASGVLALSPSLDTLGAMARSADDFDLLASVLAPGWRGSMDRFASSAPRLAICRTPVWRHAEPSVVALMEEMTRSLSAAGALLSPAHDERGHLDGLAEAQSTVMAVETAKSLGADYRDHRDQMSRYLQALIERGASCPAEDYQAALARARAAQEKMGEFFGDANALLTPSTVGEAPFGIESTGEPTFNAIWTLLHVPCVTVPITVGPKGLPLGIQVVGRAGFPLDNAAPRVHQTTAS